MARPRYLTFCSEDITDQSAICDWASSREPRIRVPRGVAVNAVVQVGRRAARVAGVADVAQDVACVNDVPLDECAEAIEVGIVVPLEPRPQDAYDLTAEPIHPHACDDSTRGADHRRSLWCEDVDPLMSSAARPGRAP